MVSYEDISLEIFLATSLGPNILSQWVLAFLEPSAIAFSVFVQTKLLYFFERIRLLFLLLPLPFSLP